MTKSESIKELATALSKFQGAVTPVKKDAINPFFHSKYATLDMIWDVIRKPLAGQGLSVTQTIDFIEGISILDTTLLHTSGEWISGRMLLNPVKNDPQGLGSAITYARRYSLSGILGIVADDDDDAEATKKPVARESTTPPQKTPQLSSQSVSVKEVTSEELLEKGVKGVVDLSESMTWQDWGPMRTALMKNKITVTDDDLKILTGVKNLRSADVNEWWPEIYRTFVQNKA